MEGVIAKEAAPDADGDGVDDAHDKCPDTPHGMRVDAQGCALGDQTITLEGVHFEFNKTRVTPDAAVLLDRLSLAFIGQPTAGRDRRTHRFGRLGRAQFGAFAKRADTVREYLIGRGARPDQLIAAATENRSCSSRPSATKADAERNRRVELKVLAQ